MNLAKFGHLVTLFVQWWLTSDQILFRRFLEHKEMLKSLGIGLGANLWGVTVLYLPIEYLIPRETIDKLRSYLVRKVPALRRHLHRLKNFSIDMEDSPLDLLRSKESRGEAISRLIETYGYDYLFVFLLSAIPVPFLGTAMTLAALFAVEALEIRFGLLVIFLAKTSKVFALASIAYFAYFL